jgi:hypothetical protein
MQPQYCHGTTEQYQPVTEIAEPRSTESVIGYSIQWHLSATRKGLILNQFCREIIVPITLAEGYATVTKHRGDRNLLPVDPDADCHSLPVYV